MNTSAAGESVGFDCGMTVSLEIPAFSNHDSGDRGISSSHQEAFLSKHKSNGNATKSQTAMDNESGVCQEIVSSTGGGGEEHPGFLSHDKNKLLRLEIGLSEE